MKTQESIVIKDGQREFDNYKNALQKLSKPLTALAEAFRPFEPVAGPFTPAWMYELMYLNGIRLLTEKIEAAAAKESPELRFNFNNYYRDLLSPLRSAIEEARRLADIHLNDKDFPHSLRTIQNLTVTPTGQIDIDADEKRIRPLFDEVLTRPQDIEYFHLLQATADQLNKLNDESRSRGIGVIGASFLSLFNIRDEEKISPRYDGLKFKLSLRS